MRPERGGIRSRSDKYENERNSSLPDRGPGRALYRPLKSPDYFALSRLSWVAS